MIDRPTQAKDNAVDRIQLVQRLLVGDSLVIESCLIEPLRHRTGHMDQRHPLVHAVSRIQRV